MSKEGARSTEQDSIGQGVSRSGGRIQKRFCLPYSCRLVVWRLKW